MSERPTAIQQVGIRLPSPDEIAELPPDGGAEFNRLIYEKSPYLLQHARNPVDWYPWGPEAFAKALTEDKPVFLSVGYSTCHWCHVMERESFEDREVAGLLNESFICVKVDREERPDIDHVYMMVTQAMTGTGGWPMTVVMAPDKKPFFAATYIPKRGRFGRPGMIEVIPALARAWREMRENVLASASRIVEALQSMEGGQAGGGLDEAALNGAYQQLADAYGPVNGGFGRAPKFPTPHNLSFLLRYWRRTGDEHALEMVEHTLTKMRLGGVCDHIGFGFHRYSTDERWLVPHFEKMLYDQALLAIAYTEAFQATGKQECADTAREVFAYVLRDMTSPEGAFYSAEDADSEGEEGRFYLWTVDEVRSVLGEDADPIIRLFNMAEGGNFRDEATGRTTGANIPHLTAPPGDPDRLGRARARLFEHREGRVRPLRDDKILTDWNGLMIASLAKAAWALDAPPYADAARRAADFVLTMMREGDGRLLKRYRAGHAGLPGHLDDYAFMAWGLIELYEATLETRYLEEAVVLTEIMLERFWDHEAGGLFMTADDSEKLLVRAKDVFDGAVPSGNAVAAGNLLRLGRMLGRADYEQRADELMRAFSGIVARSPGSFTHMMISLDYAIGPSQEVVIVGDPDAPDTQAMLRALSRGFRPNTTVLLKTSGDPLDGIAPFAANYVQVDGKATAHVCRGSVCDQPTTEVEAMLEMLNG